MCRGGSRIFPEGRGALLKKRLGQLIFRALPDHSNDPILTKKIYDAGKFKKKLVKPGILTKKLRFSARVSLQNSYLLAPRTGVPWIIIDYIVIL